VSPLQHWDWSEQNQFALWQQTPFEPQDSPLFASQEQS
jgi:hypothetical protein